MAWFLNPLVVLVLGVDGWRDRMGRLRPYRLWLLLSLAVYAAAVTVYAVRWG